MQKNKKANSNKKPKTTKYYMKKLKKCDHVIYDLYSKKMNDPLTLINDVINHYQWIYQYGDIKNLDLKDQKNEVFRDLFVFAISSSSDFANDFLNYFLFSVQSAFNKQENEWDLDILKTILVYNKRRNIYDLAAIYTLIGGSFDLIVDYIENIKLNDKISLSYKNVCDLFVLCIKQDFFDEIKNMIMDDRVDKAKLNFEYLFEE